jgi:hypothetical protein
MVLGSRHDDQGTHLRVTPRRATIIVNHFPRPSSCARRGTNAGRNDEEAQKNAYDLWTRGDGTRTYL